MQSLRILFLNQISHIGGAEKVLLLLAKQLVSRGHYVVIGAPGSGPLAEWSISLGVRFEEVQIPQVTRKIEPSALLSAFWNSIKAAIQISKIVKNHDIDVIHANHLRAILPLLVKNPGCPIVWQVHDVFRNKWPNRQLLSAIGKRVKLAVCVSKFVRDNIVKLGFPEEKSNVLHNVIEPVQRTVNRSVVLAQLGIPEEARVVALVGQIVPWKGQHILVKAASQILVVHPNVHFVIVGKAYPGAGERYEEDLKRMVKESRLWKNFHFVGFQRDVLSIISVSDVLVHTSTKSDPFPTVLLEGLSVGTAIVASRAGGVPEIIKDRENGILVEPGNAKELANAVIELLKDKFLLDNIRKKAKVSSIKFQDIGHWTDTWETYYAKCIN